MREEVWTKEESAAVDALLAVLIDNQRIAIGGEIRGLLRAAYAAEKERLIAFHTANCALCIDAWSKGIKFIPHPVLAPPDEKEGK
jgi:hypothetical protein